MKDILDRDITLINKYYNKETKMYEYKLSYIKGFWSSSDGISINGTQLTKSNGLSVRILMNDNNEIYQNPEEFKKEPKTWTLQTDDYMVKGVVNDFTTITKILENYQDVMKITDVSVKDYGSKDMWHFVVKGE